jgi:glutamate decarboxylase
MVQWQAHRVQRRLPDQVAINPVVDEITSVVPRFRLPERGLDPRVAYQLVHDEVALDGNARQNLATFVTTWMEPEAQRLYAETLDKNMIDKDEYPQTAAIEDRCVRMLAHLWHAPDSHHVLGVSTTGSSEACMLAGLVAKRRWQQARRAAGLDTARPNIVMSSAVQVVWEKFANYWEVEPRFVPLSPEHPMLSAEGVLEAVDERTIVVVVILGVTYTGSYEPVAEIAAALDELAARTGLDVPIHVDAASGGFVAPFLEPELAWDFRLARVLSINTSGHKYGLVYPGLGWVLWRDASVVPEELIFRVAYLGGDMPTLALNFSRPGAQVLLQYYTFLRLGFEGYRAVQQASREVALTVAARLREYPEFDLVGDGRELPVVAWRLRDDAAGWSIYDLAHELRVYGWQVPAYPLAANLDDVTVARVVVRNGFSMDMAHLFLEDLDASVALLRHHGGRNVEHRSFRH